MKVNHYTPLFFLFFFCLLGHQTQIHAQLSFRNANALLGPGSYHSGIAVAISDMNADGYDDIIRLSQGRILTIEFQQADGSTFATKEIGSVSNDSQWAMCVADIDNNGYNDVLTGGSYDGMKVTMAGDFGADYSTTLLPGPNLFAQGTNMADINNDGFIDAFACHDDGESRIWGNDKFGKMVEADSWIDMRTIPSSDNSGNYGSIWTDFDNDGDIDLYIAKCRQGANQPTDPRRINALFVNDGQGNYSEDAAEYGLKIGAQSWTADFQDIDNDGDLDCFITNHDRESQIMENDGTGHFTDISATAGLGNLDFPLQGVMRDFDNDGFVDILVAGDKSVFFRNNGDKTFTEVTSLFGTLNIHSYAIGDLNHDGFLDFYASYAMGYTTPSNVDDVIWMNDGNDNNYLAVNLTGVFSNRNGIGARITIYGEWGIQIREVRSGESYGIHNSFTQHFGLGAATLVDSVVVNWPSGNKDKFEAVDANQFINITEGGCISPNSNLTLVGTTEFCPGDSLVITAPADLTYLWSNGETTQSITVFQSGSYNVTVSDSGSCDGISTNVQVSVNPIENPIISTTQEVVNCPDTKVVLTASEADSYLWSNGENTQSIEVQGAGIYTVEVAGLCQNFTSPPFELTTYEVPLPVTTGDTVTGMGIGTLLATGEVLEWYDSEIGGTLLATGDTFTTPNLDVSTTYWVENHVTFQGPTAYGGKTDKGETGNYNNVNFRGLNLQFSESVRVVSAKVYSEVGGTKKISFFNRITATDLGFVEVEVPAGESRIVLNKELPISDDILMFISSNAGLFLETDAAEIDFPYPLGTYGAVTGSLDGRYYYFYEIEVEPLKSETCISERVPVLLQVDSNVAVKDINAVSEIQLFPNPGSVALQISLDLRVQALVEINDAQGRKVYQNQMAGDASQTLDVANWPRGVYFVRVFAEQTTYFGKVVLQ